LSLVFDTEALLIFYLDEPGPAKVQDYIERVQIAGTAGYLNIVNLT
jgi:hypothetical protein